VRAKRLASAGLLSSAEAETADARARLATQRVDAAEAQYVAQQAALQLAETAQDHTVIVSPIDGVVITRNVDPGQTVASALQAPLLFSVAADLRQMQVVAAVDEADIAEVEPDQIATFTVTAFAERLFQGRVTEVRNSPVIVQDVVTYGAVVAVDNLDLSLRPGMTASVRIRTAKAEDVLRLPNAALHFAPPGEAAPDGKGVWIIDSGVLSRRPLVVGISDGELSELKESGLAEGAEVLTELTLEGRKAYDVGR
jgi:HlyD family secretion protein